MTLPWVSYTTRRYFLTCSQHLTSLLSSARSFALPLASLLSLFGVVPHFFPTVADVYSRSPEFGE